jgi:hypothetical protein
MLMRRLTQTLCDRVGDKRPAMIECDVKVAVAFLCPVHVVRIRFAVGDWATVPLVVSTGREQKLQFEPIALREADGRVVHGIWGLREGKPLIAMTATPIAEVLYVRIGSGFQPAIVLCDDNESDA